MFEAKFKDGALLRKIVEAIKDLVKSVNIEAGPGGLTLQAMDSSHVALVALQLPESGFEFYRCDRSIPLGLQVENLAKILRLMGNDDQVTIETDSPDAAQLKLTFESKTGDKMTTFSLNLLQLDSEQLGIPDTQYEARVKMPSTEFARICRELGALSESVAIETTKEAVQFSVQGDAGVGCVNLRGNVTGGADDTIYLNVDEPTNLSFALRYLNLFNKAANLSNQVELGMSKGTPLVLEYKMDGAGSLKFYLAPKISEDDN